MAVTIMINDDTPQALSLINYLKTLDFVRVKKEERLTTKEKTFLKNLQRSALQAKEIANGKRKGNSIKSLLDEI